MNMDAMAQLSTNELAAVIKHLIASNFEKLVSLLYLVDVDEQRLKMLLKQNPTHDAGMVIAQLIVERQLQKQQFKKANTAPNATMDDAEKW